MLENVLGDIKSPVKILIGKGELAEKLIELIEKLCIANKKIKYSVYEGDELIVVECRNSKFFYQAIPIKLDEFAKLVKTISDKNVSLKNIEEIKTLSGELTVFMSPFCPNCIEIAKLAVEFASVNPKISVRIIDAIQFKELSEEYNVVSVPTIVVNGKVKLAGKIDEEEIINALKRDKYYEYKLGYYAYMLKEGYANELRKDIKTEFDVKVVGELLTHPMMKVRIGAMLLLEKIFRDDPKLVDGAKPKIRELLKYGDFRVKEDAALILGKIGDESDIVLLEELLGVENEDVRDSAIEAIEEIRDRLKMEKEFR